MSTPAAQLAPVVQMIPLAAISESKSNPRKTFRNIEELAEDLKVRGVLQPVLLRPQGKDFELVFGARRFRAAKLAKLPALPAFVRELTDEQTLELQIVENTQREDVHPLEEADGYRRLHEEFAYSIEEIAAKVGKSRSAVYERIKLCALVPAAREAFFAGKLSASTALLVARIPDKELQQRAVKDLVGGDEPVSYRAALDHVQRTYMLQLKDAPFDVTDAALVARAGACAACPKRTGNQRELFGDVKSPDVCTDPKCYAGKVEAAWQIRVSKAKETGQRVIEGAEAKKLFPYGHGNLAYDAGFKKLTDEEWVGDKLRSVKSLIGKDAPPPILARTPDGEIVELAPRALVEKKVREVEPARPRSYSSGAGSDDRTRERKLRLRQAVVSVAIAQLVEKAEQDAKGAFLDFLAQAILHHSFSDGVRRAVSRRGLKTKDADPDDAFKKELGRGLSDEGLRGWIVEIVAGDNAPGGLWNDDYGGRFEDACKGFGIDLKKLEEKAKAEQAEKKSFAKLAPAKKAVLRRAGLAPAKNKPLAAKAKKPVPKKKPAKPSKKK